MIQTCMTVATFLANYRVSCTFSDIFPRFLAVVALKTTRLLQIVQGRPFMQGLTENKALFRGLVAMFLLMLVHFSSIRSSNFDSFTFAF